MKNYDKPSNPTQSTVDFCGLTKLEQGALMIAQGLATTDLYNEEQFPKISVRLAKAILEACEKESEV